MPLVRAEVRNEYRLGKPELYKEAIREDPKAVLDGVVVAGLVGILRQLGDLAEFAAEVFHGLQEQVMSTASRSHKLTVRVQRIEAALPPLEKAVLSQTSHIHFAYTAGSQWHPRMLNEKNHFISNDLPRFIMDSYEVCRDPPPLHLLDKFDAGGPGSCLKRYSDSTYFKKASGISIEEDAEKDPRNRKTRKSKKRRSSHRSSKLSRGASLLNHSGRMQFTSPVDNGRISSSQTASTVDMALKSEVGEHSSSFDSRTGSGCNESVSELGSSMLPEEHEPKQLSSRLMHETDTLGSDFPVQQTRVIDDNISVSSSQEQISPSPSYLTWDEKAEIVESKAGNWDRREVPDMNFDVDVQETGVANIGDGDQMDIPSNHMDSVRSSSTENQNYEIESEPEYYMDALNTIESESENDIGCQCHTKRVVEQWSEKDVECQTKCEVEQNDGANHVNNKNREDGILAVTDDNADRHQSIIESSASSNIISSNEISMSLPDPVPSANFASEQMLQILGKSSDPDNLSHSGLYMSDEIHKNSQVESVISNPFESSASSNIILSDEISTSLPDPVSSQNFASEHMLQISGKSSDTDNLPCTDLYMSDEIQKNSQVESVINDPFESSASSNIIASNGISTSLPDPISSQNFASEQMLQISGKSSDSDNLPYTDLYMSGEIHKNSQVESVISDPFESSASSNIISSNGVYMSLPDPVSSQNFASEHMLQNSGKSSDPDNLPCTDLCTSDEIHKISQVESVISHPSSSSGPSVSDPASDRIINSVRDSENSHREFCGVNSVGFWTNGGLLGLQPSKPPDFTVSTTGQGSAAKTSEDFGPQNLTVVALHEGPKGNSRKAVENAESTEKVPGSCSEKTSLPIADLDANLEKPDTSHRNSSLDNFNGVGLSLNSSFSHGNKHPVNPNVRAASIESDEENDDNSSSMFRLGHKLLVNGFHRKVSINHDVESEPATSTKTGVSEQRNGQQSTSNQKIPWTTFSQQNGNGSPVNSLTSSPPLEHMKISFNPIDGFETFKLRLQFPDVNHYQESVRDMFPAFQLVPVPAIPVHDVASDSDDDTFCRSTPYMSDDCLSHCSESNSEQWESGETPESKDPELYDALSRLSSMESISSSLQIKEAAINSIHVNGGNKSVVHGSGAEPSLFVLPDLPSFDTINPVLQDETKSNSNQKKHLELQNTMDLTSVPPPPPPAQWRVSKPCFDEAEERQHALSESLRHELDLKLLGSTVSQKPKSPSFNQQQIDDAIALKPEKKVDEEKLNRQKEANQQISGQGVDEKEEFLHQIRSKSFNLRPTVTAKPPGTSGVPTNVSVITILQKANAIRQAVGSDDGEDDDNWSDN
ncbi:protein SCAR3 [Gossypium australe]|uniref:Protein SCAR n=1 Tax=Gossypium australe TaxID=47621 RepID=A0A5B6WB28_9ROSI|nr:protein SCAR3 [Gossypium australe]